ncbi:hypothetical protein [Lachnoclostridium sp. Marseille-P6806]|uniref:hypothetical protein n=1 Tax=Lachnoclostridium sp. Marseille-P6806 TaxID=2364793 RepID=UPI00103235FF|nr:hypothetical protein [Lachnoclostridium sp. Marseille-P6806]
MGSGDRRKNGFQNRVQTGFLQRLTENLWRAARAESGVAALILVLALAVLAAFILIAALPAWKRHLEDVRMTYDVQSVVTAKDVAKITYLQDGESGLVTYYYDELTHCCLSREKIGTIVPYGRSFAEQNRNGETGAAGIPNLGEEGGAQLLAVIVGEESVRARWTGKTWTYYDYTLMSREERAALRGSELAEMDRDSARRAARAARARYEEDNAEALRRGEEPGPVVYRYDIFSDTAIPEEQSSEEQAGGEQPGEALLSPVPVPYGVLFSGVVEVRIQGTQIETVWREELP